MAGHLDPGTLADFREGLPGRRRSAQIRAHLGTCSSCASIDRDLAQVTELLASAPPPRMPGHLVARLEDALATEAAARAATPGVPDGAHRRRRHPRRPGHTGGRPWQLRPATLGVAAGIAAVLAVGGYGLASLHPGGGVTSSAGAGVPAHRPMETTVPQGKGVTNNGLAAPSAVTAGLTVIESGTDYLPGRLSGQARAVLASHPMNPPAAHGGPIGASGNTSQPLPSCVTLIAGGLRPLLVDKARYQGRPATVIIQPATATRAGQAWVAGTGCSATSRDLIAHIQLTAG